MFLKDIKISSIFILICVFLINANNFEEDLKSMKSILLHNHNQNNENIIKEELIGSGTYENAKFNVTYTTPSGWSYKVTEETANYVTVELTNAAYIAVMSFQAILKNTVMEALYLPYYHCFGTVRVAYELMTLSPGVFYILDTVTTTPNIMYSFIGVNWNDDYKYITMNYSKAVGRDEKGYVIRWFFVTTIDDYETNYTIYEENWLNLEFMSIVEINKSKVQNPRQSLLKIEKNKLKIYTEEQKNVQLNLFDLKGRMLKNIHSGDLNGKKTFNLEKILSVQQPYLINLRTKDLSETVKIINAK